MCVSEEKAGSESGEFHLSPGAQSEARENLGLDAKLSRPGTSRRATPCVQNIVRFLQVCFFVCKTRVGVAMLQSSN